MIRSAVMLLAFAALPARAEIALKAVPSVRNISLDPFDPAWEKAPVAAIPLMPQVLVNPRGGGAVGGLRAQALSSGQRLFLRLEWEDPGNDEHNSAAERFADACAVEFPADPAAWPSPFMGDPDNPVVIWRWSAAAQRDVAAGWQEAEATRPRLEMDDGGSFGKDDPLYRAAEGAGNPLARRKRRSPVDYLAAKGYGSLTMFDEEPVEGRGIWRQGRRYVVMSRKFEGEPAFKEGRRIPVAFAVWEGGKGERNGMKSVSVWQSLEIGQAPAESLASEAAKGERVFKRYGCATCHGPGGKGGVKNPNSQGGLVPPIDKASEGFTEEELKKVILRGRQSVPEDPRGPAPPLHMNNWEALMSDEEADLLVKYLMSLAPKEKGAEW